MMTKPGKIILALTLGGGLAMGSEGTVAASGGNGGASFLRFSPSPRASGMGEAQVSAVQDPYSAYWNPAGLALVETPAMSAMYNSSFEDVNTQFLSIAYPLRYGSTLGLGISRLGVSPFQGYDSLGLRTGEVDASGISVGASYGRTLLKDEIARPVLAAGAGLKYVGARLDDATAASAALDLGAVYCMRPDNYWLSKIPAQELRLAAAVRHLGPPLKFDSGATSLPTAFTLGGSWHSHPGGNSELVVALDNVYQSGEGYYAAFGAELFAFQVMAFRAGFRTGQDTGVGIRAGLGFRFSFADLDYSMSPFGELGNMHKFGFTMRFGATKAAQPLSGETSRVETGKLMAPKETINKLDIFARDFLVLAEQNFKEARYVSALENIRRAFNLEPGLRAGVWGARETRLKAVVSGLSLTKTEGKEQHFSAPGEQARTAARAISEYISGNELKAFLLAHAAWGQDMRGPAVFEETLRLLAQLSGMTVRKQEILPMDALIRKKVVASEANFRRRDFQAASMECEEILLLQPDNILVWKRLGSAYFAMGDNDEAQKAYRKVLQLDPQDQSVRRFMALQGWE